MKKYRGPRLGTKLLLLGLVLLIIPYLGTRSLRAMKTFLFEGQEQAQLMTAQGIATLLYNRAELFNDTPSSVEGYAELPIYPLETNIQLDAFDDEWQAYGLVRKSRAYSGDGVYFRLVLGERDGNLYGLLEANDSTPANRDPSLNRLNHADHVRLYFRDSEGVDQRVQIVWEGNGKTTAYFMDKDWKIAVDRGLPDYRIQGYIQRYSNDYKLEFRIPLNMINDGQLGVAVADAGFSEERTINGLTGTFQTLVDNNPYSLMVLRSSRLQTILDSIATTNSRVWILDSDLRVRASSGNLNSPSEKNNTSTKSNTLTITGIWDSLVSWVTDRIVGIPVDEVIDYDLKLTTNRDDQVLFNALSGQQGTQRRRSLDNRTTIITAAHPIISDGEVVGTVLLEQSTHQILRLQSEALERVANLTLISLFAVILAMLLFSARLALRIRRLGRETSASIDDYGRFSGLRISRDLKAGDEIGDLARNVNLALEKLNQHQSFLANIPRTLRHEINNPLNTISTSLDNLKLEYPDDEGNHNHYFASARRGLLRISALVGKLADAANLEDALNAEEMFEFDLAAMLRAYVHNQQKLTPEYSLTLSINRESVPFYGSDIHMEQLLDKLLDNARDFSKTGGTINIELLVQRNFCQLQVTNRGPLLEREDIPNLFQMMHSKRHNKTPGHFGLGLYVARVIAEHHGGSIKAENLADGSGPCFSVRLPLV